MIRRLSPLNGLAILAVVANHAVGWTITAMFWWTNQYRPVTVPNFDAVGSPGYYGLEIIDQLALFSVPAFLFVSGYFAAYAARSEQGSPSWIFVRTRILKVIWPYLIWSGVIFIMAALQGQIYPPLEYVRQLFTGNAIPAYFFVPVLCQFLLLSPWIGRLAKQRPRQLLIGAAFIQLVMTGIFGLKYVGIYLPAEVYATRWLCVWFAFYFPLGMVCCFHSKAVQNLLMPRRWLLAGIAIGLALLSVIGAEWLYRMTRDLALAWDPTKLFTELFAVTFVLAFVSFGGHRGQPWVFLNSMGSRSYGLYLIHPLLLELIARTTRRLTPQVLAQPLLFFVILVVGSISGVLLMMEVVRRTRARGLYAYLFG